MKAKTNKKQSSELKNRPDEQRSENNPQTPAAPAPEAKPARLLPYVNFQQRDQNRALATDKVLDLLRQWLPAAYDLAEVVGKWVRVTFPEAPAETVRGQLERRLPSPVRLPLE